ncbi:MAG: SH3 domain-containing protein [Alistipes sp.]|nr:SH3 domain-containing protein [Alistipes sp.]
MKRLFFFATAMLLCASCGQGGSKAKSEANAESAPAAVEVAEAEEVVEEPSVPMAYSNAYDGYTNIREAATAKSAVLAKLHNGPKGAEILGVEGSWTKVNLDGVVGYVSNAYIQTTPTVAVNPNVTVDKLYGVWSTGYVFYYIFDNGTYYMCNQYGEDMYMGTFIFEGSELVLTPKLIFVAADVADTDAIRLNIVNNELENLYRNNLISEAEYKSMDDEELELEFGGEMVITKESFNAKKKLVKSKL